MKSRQFFSSIGKSASAPATPSAAGLRGHMKRAGLQALSTGVIACAANSAMAQAYPPGPNVAYDATAGVNVTPLLGNNTAIGFEAGTDVDGSRNTASGSRSGVNVTGNGNTATGIDAGRGVKGDHNVANGAGAGQDVTGSGNIAVGFRAGRNITADGTISVGPNSNANADNAIAIGNGATATHTNSVAIGSGSTTSASNQVSVGSLGAERTITNVAAGVAATDAVNVSQMQAGDAATLSAANSYADAGDARTLSSANSYTDQRAEQTLNSANQFTNSQVATLRKQAFSGIAQAAALSPILPSAVGKTTVNAGVASYGGQAALGVTFAHRPVPNWVVSGGLGMGAGSKHLVKVGAGFEF